MRLLDISQYMLHTHNISPHQQQNEVEACLLQWTLSYFTFHLEICSFERNWLHEKLSQDYSIVIRYPSIHPIVSTARESWYGIRSIKKIKLRNRQSTIVFCRV